MNPFHRPIEARIEPYNSKLMLIPANSGSPYYHNSWKTKSSLKEVNEQDHMSYFYQSKLVTFCPYYYCFFKYYTKR